MRQVAALRMRPRCNGVAPNHCNLRSTQFKNVVEAAQHLCIWANTLNIFEETHVPAAVLRDSSNLEALWISLMSAGLAATHAMPKLGKVPLPLRSKSSLSRFF